uniref:CCHC-type domain-containing protein n=1 Tax=Chenopodium quinoa TaxID=63459 RepID=A0A803LST0_CHEQI
MENNNQDSVFRMGDLIPSSNNSQSHDRINYHWCVIGSFIGHNPPSVEYVQHMVNSRWVRRGVIRVHKIGVYFLFACRAPLDRQGIIREHTTNFNGRMIVFRRYQPLDVPQHIEFSMAQVWARRIFERIGHIDTLDQVSDRALRFSELRARLIIDLSQPLIPGCFIPVSEEKVVWVYFRYEGIFKFCQQCGLVGHSTRRCNLTSQVARRRLRQRMAAREQSGLRILYGPMDQPYYTNMIRGLPDRYIFRNTAVNLRRLEEPEDLYAEMWRQRDNDFTGFEFDQSSPSNDTEVYYSGNSDSEEESHNQGEVDFAPNLSPSPGRHFGLQGDPYARFYPQSQQERSRGPSDDGELAMTCLGCWLQITTGSPPRWSPTNN